MHERFFGVGEPLIERKQWQDIDAPEYLRLVDGLGCRAFRHWMHLTELLTDPYTVNEEVAADYRRLLALAEKLDIEITGMSHEWFLPEGCKQKMGHAMPPRDLTSGSLYMQALDMLEQSWFTLVSAFPQVPMWEVGNEWNLNAFLHPDGFLDSDMSHPFTADEKMDIAVDMMYFAARGIRRANPKARVVSFSPALSTPTLGGDMPDYLPVMYGVAWTLDKVYSRIKSGKFWSTDTDDYFVLFEGRQHGSQEKFEVAAGDHRQLGGDPFIRFATDYAFEMPAIKVALGQKKYTSDVWMYRYELITKSGVATGWKATHAAEIPAVFNVKDHEFSHFIYDGEPDELFEKMAGDMHGDWVRFAKTGEPNPDWPRFEGADSPVRIYDRKTRTERLDRRHLMQIWDDMRFYEV